MTTVRLPVPWLGMDVASAADYVPAGMGRLVRNLLPGRRGQLIPRGRISQNADLPVIANGYDDPLNGAGGFWTRPPTGDSALLLTTATGIVRKTDGAGGTSANMAIPGGAGGLSSSYALHADYTVGPLMGNNPLLCWSTADVLTAVTNGPYQVSAVCDHQSRLFALAGRPPGGGAGGSYQNNALYWTDPVPGLPGNTLAMWQDDATGLVNKIVLPATDSYRDVVTLNRVLYVIGDRTVLALYGDTPSTYTLRKVLDIGAPFAPAGSACATDRGLYFMGLTGLVRFDGTQGEVVSDAVRPYFGDHTWSDLATLTNGYLSVIVRNRWLLFHEGTGAWAELTTGQFPVSMVHQSSLPVFVRQTAAAGFWGVSGGRAGFPGRVCNVGLVADPDSHWPLASDTTPPVDSGVNSLTDTPIDAVAVSGDIRLSSPAQRARADRLFAQGIGGWRVALTREDNSALPLNVTLAAATTRQRGEASEYAEADIVRATWTWLSPGFNLLPAAMDAHLLAVPAQQR